MRAPFWLSLARRELRSSARRLATYMGAITLGVAALVAINSFRTQVTASVGNEARALLGADLRLDSNNAFPDSINAILDSAALAGVPVSRVTSTLSVALSGAGAVRLVQVRAVEDGYPFYGEMLTEPAGMWQRLAEPGTALVEPSLLTDLDVGIGDSVRLGQGWFTIRGALTSLLPELSFRNVAGPRIYIHVTMLESTGMLRFGSLATHEAFLEIPDAAELERFIDRNHDTFRRAGVGFDTAEEQAEDLTQALESLGRFLGLVGLTALLLGGLGVASAVNAFVKDRRRTVAVLRCLGATQRTAFTAYLAQAVALGAFGAAIGALLGVGVQAALPALIGADLPIDVAFAVQWRIVMAGVAIGALTAAVFALLPLLAVRGISPLRALRHDADDSTATFDPWRIAVLMLMVMGVTIVAIWQARLWQVGIAYAGALVVGLAVLWLCARMLTALTRRAARGGARLAWQDTSGAGRRRAFPLRQGIANLYRPGNQTAAVIIAFGTGVFLVATLWVVQHNLLSWMYTDAAGPQPNVVFFDIQRDQVDSVRVLLDAHADAPPDLVPIVPARLAAINGRTIDQLLEESPRRVEPWAVRREYRHTFRDSLTSTETLVAGEWFDRAPAADPGVARVSIEQDVARNLGVEIGDRLTWHVTGVPIESVVTSVRTVDWARFETNFFFVFEHGVIEHAPQTVVSFVAVADDTARATLQREVVRRFPNISVVDIGALRSVIGRIVGRVAFAIRFMAAFSVGAGVLVLFGAISAGRFQRVREGALLRAIGATRAQVRTMLLAEYAALGAIAAFTGVILASIAGWLLMRFAFEMPFTVPMASLLLVWTLATLGAAALGALNSREVLRSTPLEALREAES